MKRTLLLILLLLAATLSAVADEKADVLKMDQQYVDARVTGDVKALSALLAPDFVAITHKGQILDRAQFMDYNTQRDLSKMAFVKDSVKVRLSGNTAVVTGHLTATGEDKKDGKFDLKDSVVTRVWVKVGGGWKLYSLHWHIL